MSGNKESGFTALEMLVSIAMGLILMAGLYSNMLMQTRVQKMQSQVTERLEDLHLVSQIMQREIKGSKGDTAFTVTSGPSGTTNSDCQDASPFTVKLCIQYTPVDIPSTINSSGVDCYSTTYSDKGYFSYMVNGGTVTAANPKSKLVWKMPGCNDKDELVRDLEYATNSGMTATQSGSAWEITLRSLYQNDKKQDATMSLSFRTYPRNK